jgi:hypothetical protein
MQMILGKFPFSLQTAAYQRMQRNTQQRWSSHERVGKPAALQHLGEGEDTISLPGVIMPDVTGPLSTLSLDKLRKMMAEGKSHTLIALMSPSVGDIKGKWVILSVEETHSEFFGTAPQKIEFTISLKRESA